MGSFYIKRASDGFLIALIDFKSNKWIYTAADELLVFEGVVEVLLEAFDPTRRLKRPPSLRENELFPDGRELAVLAWELAVGAAEDAVECFRPIVT